MRLVDGEIGIWTQAVWLQIWFILSFGLTLRSISTLQCKLFPCYTLPLSSHFIWSLKQNITSEFRQMEEQLNPNSKGNRCLSFDSGDSILMAFRLHSHSLVHIIFLWETCLWKAELETFYDLILHLYCVGVWL